MGLKLTQMMCPTSKYSIKCPYTMAAEGIAVHNTANDANAINEIKYMLSNNNTVSYHFSVDDIQAVQGIPLTRNAFHAGDGRNGRGNRKNIAIEICYSLSGGERFRKAEDNAAYLIATLLKERGWGIDRVHKHQDFSGKYCPHRTLDMGWKRFLNMVEKYLNGESQKPSTNTSVVQSKADILYAVKTTRWLPAVRNNSDYAGLEDQPVKAVMIKMADGTPIKYRVHTIKGKWMPWVTGYNQSDYNNGYAGDGINSIDAVEIKCDKYDVRYNVSSTRNGVTYYAEVSDNINDYAGVFGRPVDKLMCRVV